MKSVLVVRLSIREAVISRESCVLVKGRCTTRVLACRETGGAVILAGQRGAQGASGADISSDFGNQLTTGADGGLYVADHRKVFTQASPLAVWTIPHNLDAYPSATVVDSLGNKVEPDVRWVDSDIIQVFFSAPFAGKAYLT